MKLIIALLLAVLAFVALVFTAVWMRVQDRKNSRERLEALTAKRLQLFRELSSRWPGKDWPLLDESDPIRLDICLVNIFRTVKTELEASPQLLLDPAVSSAWSQFAKLEEQMGKARLNHAAAVKTYNRALDVLPTNVVAKAMKLKKCPRPSLVDSQEG